MESTRIKNAKTFSFSDIREDHQQGRTINEPLPWD